MEIKPLEIICAGCGAKAEATESLCAGCTAELLDGCVAWVDEDRQIKEEVS
jgi:predicted amidophosphoribosyltransferase